MIEAAPSRMPPAACRGVRDSPSIANTARSRKGGGRGTPVGYTACGVPRAIAQRCVRVGPDVNRASSCHGIYCNGAPASRPTVRMAQQRRRRSQLSARARPTSSPTCTTGRSPPTDGAAIKAATLWGHGLASKRISPHFGMCFLRAVLNSWVTAARVHRDGGVVVCVWWCAEALARESRLGRTPAQLARPARTLSHCAPRHFGPPRLRASLAPQGARGASPGAGPSPGPVWPAGRATPRYCRGGLAGSRPSAPRKSPMGRGRLPRGHRPGGPPPPASVLRVRGRSWRRAPLQDTGANTQ